ncbi:MAG: hypothetical protein BAA02_04720 [Paenibacillaceae bacterium ZCTH02-B3]|nr:MAG: hypothetical protein BAA02_04720 [Paenibacillaceae bacterium ZCTH02-B3]
MITGILSVSVYVGDQAAARAFWVDKLGFEVIRDIPMGPDGSWLEVAPPGGGTKLVLYPRKYMKGWERMQPSILFECDDIRETCARLRENGVELMGEPIVMKWGTFAQFADTEGYVHFLKERPNSDGQDVR